MAANRAARYAHARRHPAYRYALACRYIYSHANPHRYVCARCARNIRYPRAN